MRMHAEFLNNNYKKIANNKKYNYFNYSLQSKTKIEHNNSDIYIKYYKIASYKKQILGFSRFLTKKLQLYSNNIL